ncbi:MAG: cytochrome P450 [Phycisphaeraceae bacterium]|nr:cytochrome P450 [Phycisphaerales bacterium]MCB9858819.1 cytochrome P450 [Phycisphaeraceae bacterium]
MAEPNDESLSVAGTKQPVPEQDASSSRTRFARFRQLSRQFLRRTPFKGSIRPGRVPLVSLRSTRPALPFPHPWNYREPLRILETYFHGADAETDAGARHNRYLEVVGFAPVLVTRDPGVIRAISMSSGDKPGQFDRDTMPTSGIARATGERTLLYSNGAEWKAQKRMAAPPFSRSTLYQPEVFSEFADTFRHTAVERLKLVRQRVEQHGDPTLRVTLDIEIKAVMLDMLVNSFFGASVDPQSIREREVPALDHFIDRIVRDTVMTKSGCPLHRLPRWMPGVARSRDAAAIFEELTTSAIEPRASGLGLWKYFKSEASNEALRPNIRVFLAGALEATTSYASWALAHLARNPEAQEKLYREVREVEDYNPEVLAGLEYLGCVLNETLRLTPALYFHPRRATADTWIQTDTGGSLFMPRGTHVLLDVWHANRHEDHWGVGVTGFPAERFVPERWIGRGATDLGTREWAHFGFGHGPRFCPGKNLGQMEVALVVGAVVKLFELTAVESEISAYAGVSTKPADGVLVNLRIREG